MEASPQTTRRKFLKISASLVAGCTLARGDLLAAAGTPKKARIGLQLYAVRGAFSKDVPGTLEKVGRIGYQGVEFWGYGGTPDVYQGYSAKDLRKILDDRDLECCGMHLQLKALEDENLERTIENNRILGNKYLIVAAAKDRMEDETSIKELAKFLTEKARACKEKDMHVGYHAHGFDFAKVGDRVAWDILFSNAGPDVVMQMDVGNCLGGGGDPIAMLKKFRNRAKTVHIKEHSEKTLESDYFKEVFRLCETAHKTQWYIVEMGGPGGNDLAEPRRALEILKKLGK